MEAQWPETDLPDYCRQCRLKGGCGSDCPSPAALPDCRPALAAYDLCATQWRTGGLGGAVGLDYPACLAVLERYLPRWRDGAPTGDAIHALEVTDLLDDLRTIERALLTAWAERAESQRPPSDPT